VSKPVKAYGVRQRDGRLLCGVARSYAGAIRIAVWYNEPVLGVHSSSLLPLGSERKINEAERTSWKALFRRGVRVVRVLITEVAP
jgi:hypothetical protein